MTSRENDLLCNESFLNEAESQSIQAVWKRGSSTMASNTERVGAHSKRFKAGKLLNRIVGLKGNIF